jgi:hypothetical protein
VVAVVKVQMGPTLAEERAVVGAVAVLLEMQLQELLTQVAVVAVAQLEVTLENQVAQVL